MSMHVSAVQDANAPMSRMPLHSLMLILDSAVQFAKTPISTMLSQKFISRWTRAVHVAKAPISTILVHNLISRWVSAVHTANALMSVILQHLILMLVTKWHDARRLSIWKFRWISRRSNANFFTYYRLSNRERLSVLKHRPSFPMLIIIFEINSGKRFDQITFESKSKSIAIFIALQWLIVFMYKIHSTNQL